MRIEKQIYQGNGMEYVIGSAEESDAGCLSKIRILIDGETENMDREAGEGFLDEESFRTMIREDTQSFNHLFLVATVHGIPVGFSRCEGSSLKRLAHKVEFGVCVRKDYWGHGIGKRLLERSVSWADSSGIKKMELNVLETNKKTMKLYGDLGFEVEGILRKDKHLADGNYYDTVRMGRLHFCSNETIDHIKEEIL